MDFKASILASIKSISWASIFVVGYALFEFPFNLNIGAKYLDIILLFLVFYLFISVVGWLIVGFPVHLAISKWGNKNYYLYPLAAIVLFTLLLTFVDAEAALAYGLAAFVQASIFGYYVYKFGT